MAFVVVQHLAPDHESRLSEILSRSTALTVEDAEDGVLIEPNHIYVIPPGVYITAQKDRLHLSNQGLPRGLRRAIDHFFRSLAEIYQRRAVGIVFSGSGNDGTGGLRSIKAMGGLALAQNPDNAEHPSMPLSAIETGTVDKVMDVAEIPKILQQYAKHAYVTNEPEALPDLAEQEEAEDSLGEYVALLATHENFNLRQYKPSTVQRRIVRRMSLTGYERHQDYLNHLRENEEERRSLTKDLLINVTDFFRDPEAFEALKQSAINPLVESASTPEEIRIWVAGCATGEEAYTLTIVVLEALKQAGKKNTVKVFATDIDEEAIKTARLGRYPMSIAGEIPREYLNEYFHRLDDHFYQIKQKVRDLVSFAIQNVATDPPFNNMHLISCRNLLIYIKREVQEKVLGAFHYSLLPQGYLFLGTSETASPGEELFQPVSKKWRIYTQSGAQEKKKVMLQNLQGWGKPTSQKPTRREPSETASRGEMARRFILENCQPPTVVIDGEGAILYNHGELSPFMEIPPGEPQFHLIKMVKAELRSRLRSAIFKVNKDKQEVLFRSPVPVRNNEDVLITFSVRVRRPHKKNQFDSDALIVTFEELLDSAVETHSPVPDQDEEKFSQNLELELAETKEELQNTVEELETSTEELKAAHEEALSTNEELQSSNEELEASTEELRSLNEELSTVNAELREKIEELQSAKADIQNFFASTDIATVFLDTESRIQRYTPSAEKLVKVGASDLNRPIYNLGNDLVDADLHQDVEEVLMNFAAVSREIRTSDDRWFQRRVSVYRTEDRKVEGVVIVFQSITELKKLTRRAEVREKQQAAVARLGLSAMAIVDPVELMHQAVRQIAYILDADYCKVLKYQPEENNFLLIAGVGWQEGLVGKETVVSGQDSQAGYTFTANEPVIVEEAASEKRFNAPALLEEHRVTSGLSCKIENSGTPFGILGVHTKGKRKFTDDDANFLVSVANLIANAIRRNVTEQELTRSEENFRVMADNIAQLAWMTDENGYILWYNKRWYDYTGTTLDEMEGWGWKKVHHPDYVEGVVERVSHCFETGKAWEDTFPLRSKDGHYRWFLSRALPIRDEAGKVRQWFGTNTDITEQLDVQAALRESQQQLEMATKAARLGMHDYDIRSGRITIDATMREIWQLGPKDVFTFDEWEASLHPDDLEPVKEAVEQALDPAGSKAYFAQYRLIRPDASLVWVEATGTVTFENGQAVRLIGTVQDITERKTADESLRQAVAKLEVADEKKNQFLATLGHELRNPLAAVSSSVHTLELAPEKQSRLVSAMKKGVQTMRHLLDDLLDFTRVSRNSFSINLQPLNLREVLESVVRNARESAREKNQQIETEIAMNLPMRGDRIRLEQIFSNLLSNACRYTPEAGKISLKGEWIGEEIVVSVEDNGPGLPEDMVESIFEPFVQVAGHTDFTTGLGIGLALCRQLVEKHEGKIVASSPGPEKGAIFTVHFAASPQTGIQDSPDGAPDSDNLDLPENLDVLIIEDHEVLAASMIMLLETSGCQIRHAKTGEEGLNMARTKAPEVMLVDIGLPDMSGYEIARVIKSEGIRCHLIAHSGYSHDTARRKSAEAGFDHHLAKPLDLAQFQQIVSQPPN